MFLRHSYKKYEVGRDIYYFLRKPWWVEERDVTGMRGAPSGCGGTQRAQQPPPP